VLGCWFWIVGFGFGELSLCGFHLLSQQVHPVSGLLGAKLGFIDPDGLLDMALRCTKLKANASMVRQVIAIEVLEVIRESEDILDHLERLHSQFIEEISGGVLSFGYFPVHDNPRS